MIRNLYYFLKPRHIHSTCRLRFHNTPARLKEQNNNYYNNNRETNQERQLIVHFFDNVKEKSKTSYVQMIDIFNNKDIRKRNHVEFIYSALKHMKEFGVEKDLEVYKQLINVLPKGKMVVTNMFQVEFSHYPKQQQCIIDVLEQMEDNGVIPDKELSEILVKIFGNYTHPVRKYMRMLYWMPKFNNLSPWALPKQVPNDSLELAKLALMRMNSVDLQSKITIFKTDDIKEALEHTWVVSAQSPTQKKLLNSLTKDSPIFVEGPFKIWIRNVSVNYFILRADNLSKQVPDIDTDDVTHLEVPFTNNKIIKFEKPSVHEQEEGIILATCATGTSSRDSLLSWIRLLEKENPKVGEIPILFSLKSPQSDLISYTEEQNKTS